MDIGSYRVELEHRLRIRPTAAVVAAMTTLVALVAFAVPASAGSSGTATGTVAVGVRSVSVSPVSFDYDLCFSGAGQASTLVIGTEAFCHSDQPLTITNGAVRAEIEVSATNFVPSDGGTPWQLCANSTTCTGAEDWPGTDQVELYNDPASSSALVSTPGCDHVMSTTCTDVVSGTQAQETPYFQGPSGSSTDQSPTFSNTITWIATP